MAKRKNTRLKAIRSVTCGRVNDTRNVQLVSSQSSDQSRSCSIYSYIVRGSWIPTIIHRREGSSFPPVYWKINKLNRKDGIPPRTKVRGILPCLR